MKAVNQAQSNPAEMGYEPPAEWQKQDAVWLAWPWDEKLWEKDLAGAQRAVGALAKAIAKGGASVHLLIPPANESLKEETAAALALGDALKFFAMPFGDIWLRDIAPIFVANGEQLASVSFVFNGWGGKYILHGDNEVSNRISQSLRMRSFSCPLVCEGGALEHNGQGLAITTRECLLNPNRNPNLTVSDIERFLRDYLGFQKILWLEKGLMNDHTDGHIDNLARFIAPGRVVIMEPGAKNDPNREVLLAIHARLKEARDLQGRALEIVTLPSPGKIVDEHGKIMAASYLNFLISNKSLAVPIFGSSEDASVLKAFESLFPKHEIFAIFSKDLLTGGGTLHCVSQQQPSVPI